MWKQAWGTDKFPDTEYICKLILLARMNGKKLYEDLHTCLISLWLFLQHFGVSKPMLSCMCWVFLLSELQTVDYTCVIRFMGTKLECCESVIEFLNFALTIDSFFSRILWVHVFCRCQSFSIFLSRFSSIIDSRILRQNLNSFYGDVSS